MALLFLLFYSCDQINDLREFEINTDTGLPINININENDPDLIGGSFTILLNQHDIQENIYKIEEYQINQVTYQITAYDETPDILVSGNIIVGSSMDI